MRLFRKKEINLDTHSMLDKAKGKVSEAFIMFQQAHDAIEEAQDHLHKTFEESGRKIESFKTQLDTEVNAQNRVQAEMDANEKLKEQLKPFLI